MSASTSSGHTDNIAMEEDTPTPSPELARYVKALDDRVTNYSRFFHGLLVKTPDHELFFQDLRAFREQDHITILLTGRAADDTTLKQIYRDCTRHFLASRFAHPWCRDEYGKAKHGFMDTARSKQKKSDAKAKEEERLHKLLVPLWIPFRRRMIPTGEEMSAFLEHGKAAEEQRKEAVLKNQEQDNALEKLANEIDNETTSNNEENRSHVLRAKPHSRLNSGPAYFNAEAFVSEEDEVAYTKKESDGASQAAGLFVGLAATTFLASNKRARKYLFKKLAK